MKNIDLVCVICPIECLINITLNEDNSIKYITGNSCKKGIEYTKTEQLNNFKFVNSTINVMNKKGKKEIVGVSTSSCIPKFKVQEVLKEIRELKIEFPIKRGDVLIKNVAKTGVDIIAIKGVKKHVLE